MGLNGPVASWFAVGLQVRLMDQAIFAEIESARLGRTKNFPEWSRIEHQDPSRDAAPVVIFGKRLRMVIHPAPASSPFWSSITTGEHLEMFFQGRAASTAEVSWIATVGRGLEVGQLRKLVQWSAGGVVPGLAEG